MTYWKRLKRDSLYKSAWIEITLDKIELPNGKFIENFELMHFPHDSVGIVAVNGEGGILLVRAYRYLHESFNWEIPGGVIELGETPEDAVRRELFEETGFRPAKITPMISYFPHKATCTEKYHLFLVEGLEKTSDKYQTEEITEIGFHSQDEILKLIENGEIDDGLSLVALHRYFLSIGISGTCSEG